MDSMLKFQWHYIVKIHPRTLVEVEFVQRTTDAGCDHFQ